MKKIVFKMIVLAILIIGSLFQIVTLWLSDVSGRNFFYSFLNTNNKGRIESSIEKKYLFTAKNLIVHLGNSGEEFTVIKRTSKEYQDLFEESIKAIPTIINEGEIIEEPFDNDILWNGRTLIYDLTFAMPKSIFAKDLNINADSLYLDNIKSIGIAINNIYKEDISLILVDSSNKKVLYSFPKDKLNDCCDKINDLFDLIQSKNNSYYISTYKDNIDLFSNNVFIPMPSQNLLYHEEIYFNQPFIVNDEFNIDDLENYVNIFFINFDVKWKIEKENEIHFGDDRILVKYNKDGILQYNNSKVVSSSKDVDIVTAFTAAENFLSIDEKLSLEQGEYYLKKYELIDNDGIKFYYSYSYNGFPLIIDNDIMDKYNMEYPIEITVIDNTVAEYKRFLFMQDEYIQQKQVFNSEYENILDEFMMDYDIGDSLIDDMYLSYFWTDDNKAEMKWVINFKDHLYIYDL